MITSTHDKLCSFGELDFRLTHNREFCDLEAQAFDQAHVHGCYEIYINFSGDVSFLHGKEIYRIRPTDVIFSHPGEVHCCMYHSSCLHEHVCIWFERNSALTEFIDRVGIPAHVCFSGQKRDDFLELLRRISDEKCDPLLRSAHFIELLAVLGEPSRHAETPSEQTESFPGRLRNMLRYIDAHYLEELSTKALASEFFLSPSTVNRLFRVHVGLSVASLIEAKRLSYAETLLRAGKTVTDACFDSGFSDCSRFIARFKEKFGVTPLQYKKSLRGG